VAIEFCRTRNFMPMVHGYADHIFLAMHRPLLVESGHAQLIELDLFIGDRFLVSVHGPVAPSVPPEVTMDERPAALDQEAGLVVTESVLAGLIARLGLA
jgi:magnesium transporter